MESPFKQIDPTQFKRYWLDVPYADQDPRQVMDIWLPDEGEGPFPLIVFVHGGGWMFGDKRENTMPGIFKVMSQGYALACVEYRLAPAVHWPEPLFDVRAAIRYLRANAEQYNLKVDKIGALGNSAGGHLLNAVAALGNRPIMRGDHLGNADQPDDIQALVDLFSPSDLYQCDLTDFFGLPNFGDKKDDPEIGGVDYSREAPEKPHNLLLGYRALENPAAAASAGPINFVTKDFPPTYYLHGLNDQIVPVVQSVAMWRKVNAVCGEERAQIALFPGAGHGDPMMKTDEVINFALDFFDSILWDGTHERTPLLADVKLVD